MALSSPKTGLTPPLVYQSARPAGRLVDTVGSYAYRDGMPLINSPWGVSVFDDFTAVSVASNAIAGKYAGIIDTGGTTIQNLTATVGANGVLALNSDDVSEGSAIYTSKGFQLISGKRTFMEIRVRTDDVTDNAVQFGFSDLTGTTNPEDLWTTTAASLIAFGILDGAATLKMLCDLSNSGSSAQTSSDTTNVMVVNTWHTLAIYYDGGTSITGWIDGTKVLTWSSAFATTVPTATALAAFVGHLNGNGTGNNTTLLDYIWISQER